MLFIWNMLLLHISSLQRILFQKIKSAVTAHCVLLTDNNPDNTSWERQQPFPVQASPWTLVVLCTPFLQRPSAPAASQVMGLLLPETSGQAPCPTCTELGWAAPSPASNQHRPSSRRFNCLFVILAHRGYKEAWHFWAHHPTEPWELSRFKK